MSHGNGVESEEFFTDGRLSGAKKVGDEVWRKPLASNPAVPDFLEYLAEQGIDFVPRYLGQKAEGWEAYSYLPGKSAFPPYGPDILSENALVSTVALVRDFHDAGANFSWPENLDVDTYDAVKPATIDCIGHHDLAPWNFLYEDDTAVGLIDWDSLAPSNRIWDLSYLAHHFIPFHTDESLAAWGWDHTPDRARRLKLFVETYGHDIAAAELMETAVLRLASMGAYIGNQVRLGVPAFETQAKEGHASGYLKASVGVSALMDRLLA